MRRGWHGSLLGSDSPLQPEQAAWPLSEGPLTAAGLSSTLTHACARPCFSRAGARHAGLCGCGGCSSLGAPAGSPHSRVGPLPLLCLSHPIPTASCCSARGHSIGMLVHLRSARHCAPLLRALLLGCSAPIAFLFGPAPRPSSACCLAAPRQGKGVSHCPPLWHPPSASPLCAPPRPGRVSAGACSWQPCTWWSWTQPSGRRWSRPCRACCNWMWTKPCFPCWNTFRWVLAGYPRVQPQPPPAQLAGGSRRPMPQQACACGMELWFSSPLPLPPVCARNSFLASTGAVPDGARAGLFRCPN